MSELAKGNLGVKVLYIVYKLLVSATAYSHKKELEKDTNTNAVKKICAFSSQERLWICLDWEIRTTDFINFIIYFVIYYLLLIQMTDFTD